MLSPRVKSGIQDGVFRDFSSPVPWASLPSTGQCPRMLSLKLTTEPRTGPLLHPDSLPEGEAETAASFLLPEPPHPDPGWCGGPGGIPPPGIHVTSSLSLTL